MVFNRESIFRWKKQYANKPGDMERMFPQPKQTIPHDDGLGIPFDHPYSKNRHLAEPTIPLVGHRSGYQKPENVEGPSVEDLEIVNRMLAEEAEGWRQKYLEAMAENSQLRTLLIRRQ